ncbi:MAG: RNA-binding protein [Deltaproteobacteria bacterium]|nr:RNA-binding protein [Deltaproteobacteria bacterium]MBI3077630.1 RNA-binding protein [Deltaproteobacteria bacterium]
MARKLFVGSLPYNATDDELRSLFAEVGSVESCSIVTDKFTGQSRGFGFVEMSSDQEAQQAIERLNGQAFKGREIVVNEAKAQEPRGGSRGGARRDSGARRGGRW